MQLTEELRQEHQGLRAKLALLEALLPPEEGAWEALREVAFALNRELSNHAQREETLCVSLPAEFLQTAHLDLGQFHAAHHDQQQAFEHLLGLLWRDEPYPVDEVLRCVPQVIAELRAQMALEERQVFPALAEACSAREASDSVPRERRQARRVDLHVPILVRSAEEDPQRMWHEGTTKNLSCSGVYCTVRTWKPIAVNDVVTISIALPQQLHRAFPFSRLAGRGRVVRVEELARSSEPATTRLGLAVAFDNKEFTVLAASGNGYA